ncbi:MAG TPA: MarR family transcriptional regulator [Chloroflexia bacterium]
MIETAPTSEAPTAAPARPAVDQAAGRVLRVIPVMFKQMIVKAREEMPDALCDLGETQFRIIHALNYGSFTMGELAERMKVRTPTVSRMIDAMVARGLVDREPDSTDRRKVWLHLTAEGRKVSTAMEQHFQTAVARFLQPLDDEKLAVIVAACDALEGLLSSPQDNEPKHSTVREDSR